jgi:hypothetical protein
MAEQIDGAKKRVQKNIDESLYVWLVIGQITCATGILIFWGSFFFLKNTYSNNLEIWLAYERSFPFADIFWITPLLILSAFWLSKKNRKGIVTTIASGGGIVFLGLVDTAFNIQQGIYTKSFLDALLNGFLNLFCVLFGLISVLMGWLFIKKI